MLLPVAIVALRSTSLVGPAAVVNRQAIRMFAADGDGLLVACQDEDAVRLDAEAAFSLLDLNGDGAVSKDEFGKYLITFGYTASASSKIFKQLDLDGNGDINLSELRDGLDEYCSCGECEPKFIEEVYTEADALFDAADVNGDGGIDLEELQKVLLARDRYTEDAVASIYKSLDADGNGEIEREELREGFLNFARLRKAMVAVVTTLVKNKAWATPVPK